MTCPNPACENHQKDLGTTKFCPECGKQTLTVPTPSTAGRNIIAGDQHINQSSVVHNTHSTIVHNTNVMQPEVAEVLMKQSEALASIVQSKEKMQQDVGIAREMFQMQRRMEKLSANVQSNLVQVSESDLKNLADSDLVDNCIRWVTELESLGDYEVFAKARERDKFNNDPISGFLSKSLSKLTGKKSFSIIEIKTNADRYTKELIFRSHAKPSLATLAEELKARNVHALKATDKNGEKQRRRNLLTICFVTALVASIIIPFFSLDFGAMDEQRRMERIEQEAVDLVQKGDVTAAKLHLSQLKWTKTPDQDKVKLWDEKRELMLKALQVESKHD
jgi:hypothetical protein